MDLRAWLRDPLNLAYLVLAGFAAAIAGYALVNREILMLLILLGLGLVALGGFSLGRVYDGRRGRS